MMAPSVGIINKVDASTSSKRPDREMAYGMMEVVLALFAAKYFRTRLGEISSGAEEGSGTGAPGGEESQV
jgi:hypothetical protein